ADRVHSRRRGPGPPMRHARSRTDGCPTMTDTTAVGSARHDERRVVVITGGASGIGAATAARFAAGGATVVLAHLDAGRAEGPARLTRRCFGASRTRSCRGG